MYPSGALTSCKKLEKSLEWSLEIFKDGLTEGSRADMGDYIGPSRVNPGSKIGKIMRSDISINKLPRNVRKIRAIIAKDLSG